jgi:cation diffusion facilitator family transporter
MHTTDLSIWQHEHNFCGDTSSAEKRTRRVVVLTGGMMLVEIVAGYFLHSMALVADGWHMGTHVAAFVLAALAYSYGRRHAKDARFTFGTGKVGILGAFTSAIVLSLVALLIAADSIHRFIVPQAIHFREAIAIAVVGLFVNLISAFMLKDEPHHHGHDHSHAHEHHHDLNLRAAYVHVLADTFTALGAVVALTAGYFLGWVWLDPAMGLVGTIVILSWAWTLLRDSGSILLDRVPASSDLPEVIREGIENDGDSKITDLHIWQVGVDKFAAIVSIVAHNPKTVDAYRKILKVHEELVHVTIEVQVCDEHPNLKCA